MEVPIDFLRAEFKRYSDKHGYIPRRLLVSHMFAINGIPLFLILRKILDSEKGQNMLRMVWERVYKVSFLWTILNCLKRTKIRLFLMQKKQKLVRSKGVELPVDEIIKVFEAKN